MFKGVSNGSHAAMSLQLFSSVSSMWPVLEHQRLFGKTHERRKSKVRTPFYLFIYLLYLFLAASDLPLKLLSSAVPVQETELPF